jgi:predicted GIY-YIG superfamily endonuclease
LNRSTDDGIVVVMPSVYILRCEDGSLYIGHTSDLEARVHRHGTNRGPVFTRNRGQTTVVFSEFHRDIASAVARERQLKRWTRRKKEALIAGDLRLLKRL